ncbi:MAG: hypothetical protein JST82_01420 [Bacteroidetes bacterium]|nr:hypothetical protein [Bacteroidota bacterium]
MKKIIAAALLVMSSVYANAQSVTSTASQTTNLSLSNAIDITYVGNGSATGASVNFSFNSVNDYANGLESSGIQMKVRSNKAFNVSVKSSSTNFTYSGSTTPAPVMPVWSVLNFKLTSNTTGGWSWVNNNYDYIDQNNWTFLYGGDNGGNQTFTVQYRVKPGFAYPAGTYTTDVVYTATQQ